VFLKRERLSDPQRLNLYSYVRNTPLQSIDPTGKDIAVIENGPTTSLMNFLLTLKGNPVGHTAFAVTGHGVFSSGNSTKPGEKITDYILDQARNRDTTVTIIKTTPEQDKAAVDRYMQIRTERGERLSYPDNCAGRTNQALDAAGIPAITPPLGNGNSYYAPTPDPSIPGSAGERAQEYNLQQTGNSNSIEVPKGTTDVPSALNQFNPPPPPPPPPKRLKPREEWGQ
jgi:hypothetical protein